jgi:hypothetical protein
MLTQLRPDIASCVGVQEASHIKGRVVELLPPPPLPTTWAGSFQRRLPVARQALQCLLLPFRHRASRTASTRWLPPVSLPPPPQVATLQYDLAPEPEMRRVPENERQLRLQLAKPEVKPWPAEYAHRLRIHVPPLYLTAYISDAPDEGVEGTAELEGGHLAADVVEQVDAA